MNGLAIRQTNSLVKFALEAIKRCVIKMLKRLLRVLIWILVAGPIAFGIAVALGMLEVRIPEEAREEHQAAAAKESPALRFHCLHETEKIFAKQQLGITAWTYVFSGGMLTCWAEIQTGTETRTLGPLPRKETWRALSTFDRLKHDERSGGFFALTMPENGKAGKYRLFISWDNNRGAVLEDEAALDLPELGAGHTGGFSLDSSQKMRGEFKQGSAEVIRKYQLPAEGGKLKTLVSLKAKFFAEADLAELR